MYRKELKVLDCTIRDGGLINNYQFTKDFVKAGLIYLKNYGERYR